MTQTVETHKIDVDVSAAELSKALADTYTLYLKTQNFHWNVEGALFQSLHELFEQQYTELAEAVDEVAERIRALRRFAPGSFAAFQELKTLDEAQTTPSDKEMAKILAFDNEKIADNLIGIIARLEDVNDVGSADLLTAREQVHRKAAWMLRSLSA